MLLPRYTHTLSLSPLYFCRSRRKRWRSLFNQHALPSPSYLNWHARVACVAEMFAQVSNLTYTSETRPGARDPRRNVIRYWRRKRRKRKGSGKKGVFPLSAVTKAERIFRRRIPNDWSKRWSFVSFLLLKRLSSKEVYYYYRSVRGRSANHPSLILQFRIA